MSRRMQRRSNKMFLSPSLLLVGILIAGIAWFTSTVNATSPTSGKPTPTVPPTLTFQRSHTYVEGNPGIQSHSSAALVKTGATFTQQDVIAFFTQHGFYAGPVVPGSHMQFLTIQFVTAAQASQLMAGEDVGRPDTTLVCYVKVQGPFLLTHIRGGPAPTTANMPATAKYGDAVFDAATGNLLVWGVYYT